MLGRKFGWAPRRVQEAAITIRGFATMVAPTERITVIPHDDPDNRIIECAVHARAGAIVTGDRLLQALGAFRGIAIINPRQFLEREGRSDV